ncbi:uncharacterized protein I206_104569 [Kwoniella pini CBS 10737]|uniref:WSC domain-containing protein n=1 Tax=Kwoniella pini CBS 10737 TaxID=1296096 RepID=A0A1B9I769_9TREE|nr:uncharacterized protein I206_02104 [Kwoniella pini CBS 10737]OCF51390.1 hypothetical protein I206_02104 [Kwoniella pini CBS 10737]
MKLSILATLLLTALPSFSTPLEERSNEHFNHIENRATRSSQGWYAYGCYFDCYDGMNRRLPILAYVDDNNNPDMCIQWCKDNGHNYAGVQWTKECYCGDSLAGEPAPPTECTHQCADGKNKCGGPCRNNIWSAFQKPGH